jgi:hypothetical protein
LDRESPAWAVIVAFLILSVACTTMFKVEHGCALGPRQENPFHPTDFVVKPPPHGRAATFIHRRLSVHNYAQG